jgi:hypothetical protein
VLVSRHRTFAHPELTRLTPGEELVLDLGEPVQAFLCG